MFLQLTRRFLRRFSIEVNANGRHSYKTNELKCLVVELKAPCHDCSVCQRLAAAAGMSTSHVSFQRGRRSSSAYKNLFFVLLLCVVVVVVNINNNNKKSSLLLLLLLCLGSNFVVVLVIYIVCFALIYMY